MLRSPISKDGKLNYRELFEYSLLLALLVSLLSGFMNNNVKLLINMGYVMLVMTQTVFIIQIGLLVATLFDDIHQWLKSLEFNVFKIPCPRIKNCEAEDAIPCCGKYISKQQLHKTYCVIRC